MTARVIKSVGFISLEASWSQFRLEVSTSENSFIRICAEAMLFACHHAELEYNSVKALKVKIQDSFETSVATKIKKTGKNNRRICRDGPKLDEFYAMLAGRQAEIINEFRPMGQRFLQGDAKLNCITAWYPDSGDPFWVFNFEGDSQSAPPYEECSQLPPQYGMW
ncbi:hypothetical protein NUU61_005207 [Penicillium alfredii]|uniref:Uncharacterized protein n=1 Tax=Penicillium alfredii TaxID=1506179 RepID=A0A9W9K7Y4_9EURO|nr:uncharacterized protein NUU61_005207 [Penicillium alfredii]KAJ5095851.1 hypothetical protein NUU61_005207 [Penicillium alfredii]